MAAEKKRHFYLNEVGYKDGRCLPVDLSGDDFYLNEVGYKDTNIAQNFAAGNILLSERSGI